MSKFKSLENNTEEIKEQSYIIGYRAAMRSQLATVIRELGYDGKEDLLKERLILEREETVARLRSLCDKVGDNDWNEKLHLGDVIDKHLANHLIE